jgi:hypothetical protein
MFDQILNDKGYFGKDELKLVYEKNKAFKQIEIKNFLSRHIARHNYYTDQQYDFLVIKDKKIDFTQI